MVSLCCFGICIPLNLLWPVLLLFLKPLIELYNKTFGAGEKAACMSCDSGICSISGSETGKSASTSAVGYESSFEAMSSRGPIALTKEHNLRDELLAAKRTVVLRFTAPWCKPCKEVEPLFNSLCASSSALIGTPSPLLYPYLYLIQPPLASRLGGC